MKITTTKSTTTFILELTELEMQHIVAACGSITQKEAKNLSEKLDCNAFYWELANKLSDEHLEVIVY